MKEFVRADGNIYLNVPYAEMYIPETLFKDLESESAVAVEYGEGFKLVGLCNMRFFDSDTEPRDSKPLQTFNYPNTIICYPDSSTSQTLKLTPDSEPEKFRVLKFYFGDIIMSSESVQAVQNCTKFMNMITRGKIPNSIPYDVFVSIWANNFKINNFNPGVPSVVMQMVWAHLCRDAEDVTVPFRMVYGKGNPDNHKYQSVSMNMAAAATSVFSGLSFERITEKTASGINMSRSGAAQMRSPVEEVLTM